ncbi:protein amnionless [Aplochiton taeniatus]
MQKVPVVFCLLCLVGATNALYKQWIPDTNYENKTNWDNGVVPCGADRVSFSAHGKVAVYVETIHSVQEMRLPVVGEFILNSGSGFYVGGGAEPGCGAGVAVLFKDSEALQWFNPALWQAASTMEDLEKGRHLFSVHEQSVPCQHDDVVFRARSSFRVDTTSSQPSVPVQSVSVLGKKFSSSSEFSQYLSSGCGRLQFHGASSVSVGSSGCSDPSGCECGNSANHERICGSVTCPSLGCKKPLRPAGHCCDVCGAIVTVQYTADFSLEAYRRRLEHLFLSLPTYKSIQLGMSKVLKPQWFIGIVPGVASAEIQVVMLDGETGSQSGMVAEALALDIVKDGRSQGSHLGIAGVAFQASSGSSSSGQGSNAGVVVGAVFGALILLAALGLVVVLFQRGIVKLPSISLPSLGSLRRNGEIGELGGPLDHGFDNPMFDKPTIMPAVPGLYETNNSISITQSGVHFVNPVYDESETDFSS